MPVSLDMEMGHGASPSNSSFPDNPEPEPFIEAVGFLLSSFDPSFRFCRERSAVYPVLKPVVALAGGEWLEPEPIYKCFTDEIIQKVASGNKGSDCSVVLVQPRAPSDQNFDQMSSEGA